MDELKALHVLLQANAVTTEEAVHILSRIRAATAVDRRAEYCISKYANRIDAIKAYRAESGASLNDARNAIDAALQRPVDA